MKMMNRVTRLSVAVGLGFAALVATAPARAEVARYQLLTLDYPYPTVKYYLGTNTSGTAYPQGFTLTLNPCDGTFSGPGLAPPFGLSETEGAIDSVMIAYTTEYDVTPPNPAQTDYAVKVAAILSANYSFSGLWSDNYIVGNQSGAVVADKPTVTSSAYRNHGDFVSQNPDKNDAAHSCIGMPIEK
jgi:hypothetical protein